MPRSGKEKRPNYTAKSGEAVRVFHNEDGSYAVGYGRVTVASTDMAYVAAVVGDLTQLAFSRPGEEALRQGDAMGRRVRITKPDPPTEPPNGWIIPDDLAAATSGTGCGSTIVYDPADWPRAGDRLSPSSSDILLLLLRQANTNAAGKSDPADPAWGVVGVMSEP
jgi:hypothetical protein